MATVQPSRRVSTLDEFRRLLDQWTLDDLHHLLELLRPLFWAYALGSTILAALAAALAYRAALAFLLARRRWHSGSGHPGQA